jgi:hypothetical protein
MLDFEKFDKPFRAIVPVRNGSFVYQKKTYKIRSEDGWFLVRIKNNKVSDQEPVVLPLQGMPHPILGYTHHNNIVFQNADVARRKHKLGMMAPLHFNQSPTFEAIQAIVWEDGECYWTGPNYSDAKIFEIKDAYEAERALGEMKGVTPELRVLYLHHTIERDTMKKMLAEAKAKEELEALMTSIPGRLHLMFQRAGGKMTNYSLSGSRIIVDWTVEGSHHQFNSVIDANTWMVVEAGYCMSGDDQRHNITSMVKTAQIYDEQRRMNITRFSGDDALVRGPHLDREVEDDEDW